jgi:hypothetical protein
MFIPRYWAEAQQVERLEGRKQVTVRRFGWSSTSPTDAEVHARQRVEEAVAALRSGGPEALAGFTRRERKVAYAGGQGLPIREEIVREWPEAEAVLTRNGYGALCLNTTRALFVDVDQPVSRVPMGVALVTLAAGVAGILFGPRLSGLGRFHSFLIAAGVVGWVALTIARLLQRRDLRHKSPVAWALARAKEWCASHPAWRVAVYETPGGARLLPLHAPFDPAADETYAFMEFVGVDPLYARMSRLQQCFRARVSAKPWRAGISEHFHPGGVWPVTDPTKLARRAAWVETYERAARKFAACRLVEVVGAGRPDPGVLTVQAIHDDLSQATSRLPLA